MMIRFVMLVIDTEEALRHAAYLCFYRLEGFRGF